MGNNTKILASLAAGAVLGVLLAPDKGSNTRRKLKGQVNNIEDNVDKMFHEAKKSWKNLQSEASDKTADAESYFNHLVAEGRKSLREAKYRAENGLDDAKSDGENTVSKLVNEGKRLWNNITGKAEDAYDEAKDKAKDVASNVKEAASNVASNVKSTANTYSNDVKKSMS